MNIINLTTQNKEIFSVFGGSFGLTLIEAGCVLAIFVLGGKLIFGINPENNNKKIRSIIWILVAVITVEILRFILKKNGYL